MKLEVKDIYKNFGETEILHGISFSIESGKALGLLGRNGAGKTTTIRIIMDVFKANKGEVLLDGKPFNPLNYQIGYLPEERGLYPKKTVVDQLTYLAQLRGISAKEAKESTKYWLKRLGIEEYLNRKLETLSKGNQQKVQLAQTLLCDPEIVILDEPFSGLDPVNSQILKEVVQELIQKGKLVIFSSHQMNYVEEFCEDIVIMNHGNIVLSGNLKNIKKDFGKNKLILIATNYENETLKNIILKNYKNEVKECNATKQGCIITLNENITKKDLLNKLVTSDIDINKFGDYEPELTDIFVEKAGDE